MKIRDREGTSKLLEPGDVSKEELDALDKEDRKLICCSCFTDDLWGALSDVRCIAPVIVVLAISVGFFVGIRPYRIPHDKRYPATSINTMDDVARIRPVLTEDEQFDIKRQTMWAETEFCIPSIYKHSPTKVRLRFDTVADHEGHHEPPSLFYDGVVYGVSAEVAHDNSYTHMLQPEYDNHRSLLQFELSRLSPAPTVVMKRVTQNNETGFLEEGWALHYNYKDLKQQGKLSANRDTPWARVEDNVLSLARAFNQMYIYRWHPHRYGSLNDESTKYQNIIQEIVPTRTGMQHIKSSVVVWMTHINANKVVRPEHTWYVKKKWTKDDHWSHYDSYQPHAKPDDEPIGADLDLESMGREKKKSSNKPVKASGGSKGSRRARQSK
jgi:hypothetical protein